MIRTYHEQTSAIPGDKMLDPWYKRMLLKKLDEEFGNSAPAPGTTPSPVAGYEEKNANPAFLAGLSGPDGNANQKNQEPSLPFFIPEQTNLGSERNSQKSESAEEYESFLKAYSQRLQSL